jgi:hypothetical protein
MVDLVVSPTMLGQDHINLYAADLDPARRPFSADVSSATAP